MATINGTDGNDTITPAFASPGVSGGTATGGADSISGRDGNDSINSGGGSDTILGGDDNDTILGGDGGDRLQGDRDDDSVDGGTGNDTIDGNFGDDTLVGGVGDDLIDDGPFDGSGDDSITGDAGNDTLVAGSGSDTIDGGAGNDLILGTGNTDEDSVFRGGTGIDTLRYSSRADLTNFSYATTSIEIFDADGNDITGTSGNDTLDFRGVTLLNVEEISGESGDDFIAGNDAANVLRGSSGENTILGGGGNDTIISGIVASTAEFAELLDGGDGRDTIDYSIHGPRTIDLLAETATRNGIVDTIRNFENVIGSASADLIRGNGVGNGLDGGGGNDTILGLGGNDTITGGAGTDSLDGGIGTDTVDYTFATDDDAGGTVNLGTGQATIGGITETILNFENANGSQRGDLITGKGGDNRLAGFGGADTLLGLDGNDTLIGGGGADSMVGGLGNDTYVLTDALDTLVELAGQGIDTVESSLTRTLALNFENLTLTGAAAINGTGNVAGNVITGNAAGNVLSGLGGADTLTGGGGADTLIGGAGADRFDFNALTDSTAAARDVIQGFDGPGAAAGDRIDLVDVFGGVLSFIGVAAFTAVGQVRVATEGANTVVQVNTAGTLASEMEIVIADGATLASAYTGADFIL